MSGPRHIHPSVLADIDRCRPHGIRFDRDLCPPDDPITDALCAIAASIANARLDVGLDLPVPN